MSGKLVLTSENHNVSQIGLHLVWCTKYRNPVLVNEVEFLVRRAISQTCGDNGWRVCELEIMPDHVHLFIQINPTDTPTNVVKTLKSTSAIAVFYQTPLLKRQKFWGSGLWSRGTYYGSVGQISQDTVLKYIQSQKTKGKKNS